MRDRTRDGRPRAAAPALSARTRLALPGDLWVKIRIVGSFSVAGHPDVMRW